MTAAFTNVLARQPQLRRIGTAARRVFERRAGADLPPDAAVGVRDTHRPSMGGQLPRVAFEDRMGTVEFRIAPDAHIVVDGDQCRGCTTRECITACPANLFVPTADGGVLFNYEQCFECGTCYMICNKEGAITWRYPEGGHGVVFHRS